MNNVKSNPILMAGNDGSIVIGLVNEDIRNLADKQCFVQIKTKHLIGKIEDITVFDFDLDKNSNLENIVEFAFSNDEPMLTVWEAQSDGMIPLSNLIFLDRE